MEFFISGACVMINIVLLVIGYGISRLYSWWLWKRIQENHAQKYAPRSGDEYKRSLKQPAVLTDLEIVILRSGS